MRYIWGRLYEFILPSFPVSYPPLSGAKADDDVGKVARRRHLTNRVLVPILTVSIFFLIVTRLLSMKKQQSAFSSYTPIPKRIIAEHARKLAVHRSSLEEIEKKVDLCKKENPTWSKHRLAQGRFNLSGVIMKHMIALPRYMAMSGTWEGENSNPILHALQELGSDATLIDIGAGLGWQTLSAAYSGYQVITIEPDMNHLAMLRHSLCLAPESVGRRVTVMGYALGQQDGGTCSLWKRHGATVTICDEKAAATTAFEVANANSLASAGYSKIGLSEKRSIDGLQLGVAGPHKVVMKVDISGYEPFALYGAAKLLRDAKPKFLYVAFNRDTIELAAINNGLSKQRAIALPDEFLSQMSQAGYDYTETRTASNGGTEILLTRA